MIPYFELTSIPIGPITIQVWGLMVAIGIFAALQMSLWLARRREQDQDVFWDTLFWAMVGAFVFARLFHVFGYNAAYYLANPLEILLVWHGGWSSVGGLIGGSIAGIWSLRRRYVDVWAYADTAVFGLPVGFFLGRIGCFLIHDHPGTATDFALGVTYPDGIVRHDLGLYLALNALALTLVHVWLVKRKAKTGTFIIVFLVWYGVSRFFLDFLRAYEGAIVDTRYLGLTPAQYISVLMVVAGLYIWKVRKQKNDRAVAKTNDA